MTIWAVSLLKSELSPGFLTALIRIASIRSLVENPTLRPPILIQSLYLLDVINKTLALKLFRREPAIAKLDWNFSSTHKSSPSVARLVGAGLHALLRALHPAHM